LRKNRFLLNLAWELKNLFRFPFPEILLALFTFMMFLWSPSISTGNMVLGDMPWQYITRKVAIFSAYWTGDYSVEAYLPQAILGSIFATLAFAHEIENGLLKVHLSHPTSKRAIFMSKWLSCFLALFTTLSCALLFFAFLYVPQNGFYMVMNPDMFSGVLVLAALETFFVVSVTVSFSLFSRKASISLVGSFATLYIVQLLSRTSGLTFLPPASFQDQSSSMFALSSSPFANFFGLPQFFAVPLFSAVLTVLSYIYFSRRLELA
jgi:ABC-type transport system involved in multi-copper enzyme maturation permease subunit